MAKALDFGFQLPNSLEIPGSNPGVVDYLLECIFCQLALVGIVLFADPVLRVGDSGYQPANRGLLIYCLGFWYLFGD
ncbi:hypothetical protein FOXYSP1_06083 [Fusarium oxysporum f. sp. phaseoli]